MPKLGKYVKAAEIRGRREPSELGLRQGRFPDDLKARNFNSFDRRNYARKIRVTQQ